MESKDSLDKPAHGGFVNCFDRDEIKRRWVDQSGGFGAQERWDLAAPEYASMEIPCIEDDPFLSFLAEEARLNKNMRVLDIGCGSGIYGLAIAPFVDEVIGVDLSPKMIEAARQKAIESGCENAHFLVGDFLDLKIEGSFDIVFAHMTPAISSGAAFEKMMAVSHDWCFLAMPVRRVDNVLYELRARCDVPVMSDSRDENFLQAFCMMWLDGCTPVIRHYKDIWHPVHDLEEARVLYADYLVAEDLNDDQKRKIYDYLEAIQIDGMVHEKIETTIVMMGWQKASS